MTSWRVIIRYMRKSSHELFRLTRPPAHKTPILASGSRICVLNEMAYRLAYDKSVAVEIKTKKEFIQ